jgi:hypothetical protein
MQDETGQAKYGTDSYSLTMFNDRGAKLAKVWLGNNLGLVRATEIAREKVQAGEAHSFVVERVLMNSMDTRESWQAKGTGRYSDGKPYEGK